MSAANDTSPAALAGDTARSESPSSRDFHDDDKAAAKTDTTHDFPEGGARAWCVAAGNGGVMFCTLGLVNSFGVFQTYYELNQLRSTSPSTIAWIGSLQACFIFAGGAFGGPLFDRYGAKVIRPAAVAYVFSIMMMSISYKYWHFLLAQGILGGVSNGMVMTPAMSATPQYFNKKRGGAMGLAIAGSSIGGVIFPIALNEMFQKRNFGFGWSVRIVGFICLFFLTFACIAIKARLPPRKTRFFLPRAFLEPQYAFLCAATFFLFLGQFTPFFYLPTYALTKGMGANLAFYLIAILNAASLPGRVLPGILADKFGRMNMLFYAGLSTGMLGLVWQATHTNAGIIVWAVFFGFCSGAIVSGVSVSLASCPKSPTDIGTYMGMGLCVASVAALIGPPISGALYNSYNDFGPVADFAGVMCIVGGLLVIPAKLAAGHSLFSKN